MSSTDPERAFPCVGHSPDFGGVFQAGMTLRDHFAAKAMQALIAKLPLLDHEGEHGTKATPAQIRQARADVAECSYFYADAMLAERDKP